MEQNKINILALSKNQGELNKAKQILEELPFPVFYNSFTDEISLLTFLDSFKKPASIVLKDDNHEETLILVKLIRKKLSWERVVLTVVIMRWNEDLADQLYLAGVNIMLDSDCARFKEQSKQLVELFWQFMLTGEDPKNIIIRLR